MPLPRAPARRLHKRGITRVAVPLGLFLVLLWWWTLPRTVPVIPDPVPTVRYAGADVPENMLPSLLPDHPDEGACDESQGEVLDSTGINCIHGCPGDEAISLNEDGINQCIDVEAVEKSLGAFVALFVYNSTDQSHASALSQWLHSAADYNAQLGMRYPAVVFYYGPALTWANVEVSTTTRSVQDVLEVLWVDISRHRPFEVPEHVKSLVPEQQLQTGMFAPQCHDRGWPAAYIFMIRFRLRLMWEHHMALLSKFAYLFQLDYDCTIDFVGGNSRDVFAELAAKDADVGYYSCGVASQTCAGGSWDFVKSWVEKTKLVGASWPTPQPVKNMVYMGGMVIYSTRLFGADSRARELTKAVDEGGYPYTARWSEHLFYTYVPAVLGRRSNVCYMGGLLAVTHNGSPFAAQSCPKPEKVLCVL